LTHLPQLSRRLAIAFIASCLFPLASAASADATTIRTAIDSAIGPLMAEYEVPGMAIAVTVDGKPFFFNYGVASREKNTPVNEATLFEIGSISKTFTATLATYAQTLGKLAMDQHPDKYLPQLKGSAIAKASLLNLGTYTAGGLPLQFPDEVSDQNMIAYFQQWKPDAAAGTQREYSNPSLGLFGHIAALALKSDFADAMETQIFPPLGLHHSYIRVPEAATPNYAWGYNKSNQAIRVNPGVFDAQAYGVKSTAADMIRFVQANIDPSRLPVSMRRAVEGTHIGYFKIAEMVQGLGWEQYPYPISLKRLLAGNSETMIFDANAAQRITPPSAPTGLTLFNKTGSTGGFGSYVAFVPEKKIGIVILANKNFPIPARIKAAHAILEQLALTAK
jgi:beta-lactamase class C